MNGPPDLLLAAFHWLEYLGLLGGLGSFVVRRLGRQPPRVRWAQPPMAAAFAAALAGGVGVLALGPTVLIVARVAAEAIALVLCVRGIQAVAPFAVLATLLLSPASHAAALAPAAVFLDAVHVLSAGMWAGGILALASLRPPGGWTGAEARAFVARFARVAVVAFGVTALTGVLRAAEQLAEPSGLWTTEYGAVLLLKSAAVLVMLALSLAWRRGWPASRADAAAAIVATGATALLAAFPLPVN